MKVEEILEEMENILLESSRLPFTNKRVVEEDDLARLIDDLRDAMPSQLVEAGRIVSDRQRILEEAQQKSDEIVQQAKAYHSKLTDENLITRQAQEQAGEIVTQARRDSEQMLHEAEQKAEKCCGKSHRPGKPRQQHRANAQQGGRLVQTRGDKDCNGRDAGHKDDRGAHKPGGNGGIANDERRHQTDRVPQRLRHPQPGLPDNL